MGLTDVRGNGMGGIVLCIGSPVHTEEISSFRIIIFPLDKEGESSILMKFCIR
jgi:hypothetical protein